MSDIPVGSPPPPPGRHAAPGGWYPDPVDPGQERYWDGWQWSRTTRERESAAFHPPYAPPGAPIGGGYAPQPGYQGQPGYPQQPGYPGRPGYPGQHALATADGVPLAGWWWRVLAAVVDNLITSTVVGIVAFPILQSMTAVFTSYFREVMTAQTTGVMPSPTPALVTGGDAFILSAVTLGIGMAYQVLFVRWKSATPGKLLCHLRVVPVNQGRATGPLGWHVIGVRAAVKVMPGIQSLLGLLGQLFSVFVLVDGLFPLWHPQRQALHDIAAKTQVVRLR